MHPLTPTARRTVTALAGCFLGVLAFSVTVAGAADPKKSAGPAAPRSAVLKDEDWLKAPLGPVQPGEIDRLVTQELRTVGIVPAPRTTDEQFIRRVYLDLIGELPVPADVREFAAAAAPHKRAKRTDKPPDSDESARQWALYWRDVISSRLTDIRGRLLVRGFEEWLTGEIKRNASWAE